ncbi:MAG: PD-(D/E)XK nuclease family protein [Methanobrevibacter sp.]|nr:PD-(D/E)XK nuclease family protein [Methanobrevibacter sp.]
MRLSSKSKEYIIPEYSLTGDLLSFLTCNLQYRYQNKGTLPPSMPKQLWFGEFIHGVMEEAYLKWKNENISFDWSWIKHIRPIEKMIDLRLRARGLYPPLDYFCPYSINEEKLKYDDSNHPHKLLASARAESAINTWGPYLFPLISSAEVLLKGIRNMPNYNIEISRSNYYGINGVIDVLSSLKIDKNLKDSNNSILKYLSLNDNFYKRVKTIKSDEYEIIIDYKGMKRPTFESATWNHHSWQILTYAWLRSMQEESKPIAAGIIFYLNELVPSIEDIISIQKDVLNNGSDLEVEKNDYDKIENWNPYEEDFLFLSDKFKMDRSIRIVNIENNSISHALTEFDDVVSIIEDSVIKEANGFSIKKAWKADADKRTCDACDFKSFCNNKKLDFNDMKVP